MMDSQQNREASPPIYYYDVDVSGDLGNIDPGESSTSGARRRRKFLTESEERELSGSTDRKERRRIQNRVAQRAYRQKQKLRLQELEERLTQGRSATKEHDRLPEVDTEALRASGALAGASSHSWSNLAISYPIATTLNTRMPTYSSTSTSTSRSSISPIAAPASPESRVTCNPPIPPSNIPAAPLAIGYISSMAAADLPASVTPFITISVIPIRIAILMNLEVLGLSLECYTPDSALSPFISGLFLGLSPTPLAIEVIISHLSLRAPDLVPTQLQLSVSHHPYIDVLPFPSFRDRLLTAIAQEGADAIDQSELAADVEKGLRVWGKMPWDHRACEWTEQFVRKWAWLMDEEALEASNFWRTQRGEGRIEFGSELDERITKGDK